MPRHWMRWLVAMVLAALWTSASAQIPEGETRVALVIANDAYVSPSLGRLPGTQRDAALVSAALQRAGFEVVARTNLNRVQMRAELSAFARRLHQLGPQGVGFLYYAGHGVADGPRGQNYLVPVDADILAVTDLATSSLPLNEELDAISVTGAKGAIIVIDACRNTPVALSRGSRGLVPVSARTDTLVAFSTDANETASDDGLYARVLSEELVRPGADAIAAFARVQSRVAAQTQRIQRPRYDNGLLGEPIVFVPSGAEVVAPPPTLAPAAPPTVEAARRLREMFERASTIGIRRPGGSYAECRPLQSLSIDADAVRLVCGNGEPHGYGFHEEVRTIGQRVYVGRNLRLGELDASGAARFTSDWGELQRAAASGP